MGATHFNSCGPKFHSGRESTGVAGSPHPAIPGHSPAVKLGGFCENLPESVPSPLVATLMNQQQRALLDEVVANPSADTPRRIYADYLEEAGDPRGEFVRLQCDLEQLDVLDARYLGTLHRCEALLRRHEATWMAEQGHNLRVSVFQRGFIDTVTVRARAFLRDGESLYHNIPIRWLRLNHIKGLGKQLAKHEALSSIQCLDLAGLKVPDEDLIALLNSRHLNQLRALKLGSWESPVSADVGGAIRWMPSATSIQQLHIAPGDGFFQAFARGAGLPQLRELSLGMTHCLQGLSALGIENLTALTMTGTLDQANTRTLCSLPLSEVGRLHCDLLRLETDALAQLADQGIFSQVEDFRLNNSDGLDVDSCHQVFRAGRLSRCKRIEIASIRDTPDEVTAAIVDSLAGCQSMTSLRELRISQLAGAQLQRLVESPVAASLRSLTIENSRLDPHDVQALCQSPLLDSLRELTLSDLASRPALKHLRDAQIPNLLRLGLGAERPDSVEETLVLELIRSRAFPVLQRLGLNLSHRQLSPKVLLAIANESHLIELRELDHRGNRITRSAAAALFASDHVPRISKLIHSEDALQEYFQNKYGCRVSYAY